MVKEGKTMLGKSFAGVVCNLVKVKDLRWDVGPWGRHGRRVERSWMGGSEGGGEGKREEGIGGKWWGGEKEGGREEGGGRKEGKEGRERGEKGGRSE